jgi:hypothetical protein
LAHSSKHSVECDIVEAIAHSWRIKEAWTNIGQNTTCGDLTLAELQASITDLETAETVIARLQDLLTNARNELKDKRYTTWNLVKRVRAGAKAKHGDDSDEYERFGGTRLSDRRVRRRRQPDDAA